MRFRTRAMLASTLLAVGLLAFAPHASAQEEGGEEGEAHFTQEQIDEITHEAELIAEENGGTEIDGHCIPILIEGGSPDDCQEAPSPILPETNELIWGGISFLLLLALMWKFAFPALKDGMNARTERIRADLDAAESAKTDAVSTLDSYKAQLADAKAEAARIIEEARQSADALKRDQEARLQTELAEARTRAAADIEAAKAQATADLRGELAQLAVGAASAVVNKNLDAATQTQLIEDYINQVGEELMADERSHAYAEALLAVARSEGATAEVGDELFRFARVLEGNDELRTTLTDQQLPVSRRQQIVEDLLGGRAHPITTTLVSMVVGAGRARDLPAIIDDLVQLSAAEGNKEVAEVRSAVELSDDQKQRLVAALEAATGKKVELKVVIDPSVLGGLVAQVGDTVIDGSVRSRLQQLQTAF